MSAQNPTRKQLGATAILSAVSSALAGPCICPRALTVAWQPKDMTSPAIAANVLEPLDVEQYLLLQRRARCSLRLLICSTGIIESVFDKLALRLCHPRERIVAKATNLSCETPAAHAPVAKDSRNAEFGRPVELHLIVLDAKALVFCLVIACCLVPDKRLGHCHKSMPLYATKSL
eukprot:6198866-Pleurochrysis_carterae.AAC.2